MKYQLNGLKFILVALGVLWTVELINFFTGRSLQSYGIIPRTIEQSYGILTAPWIHRDMGHLISNSIPLVFLAFLVHQTRQLLTVTVIILLGTGVTVWLLGRDAIHIGASGILVGYWGFLIANGWLNHSIKNILLSLIALAIYGGLLFSLFDFRAFISYESHLAGFCWGVFSAYALKHKLKPVGDSL